jgi:hypothetical protein
MEPERRDAHMQRARIFQLFFPIAVLTLAALACGGTPAPSEPKVPIAPITVVSDLTQIDVCAAIPQEDIEAVMGSKLAKAPERFEYYDTGNTGGCWYEAKKGADGEAHFGYVVLTPIDVYENQPLYMNADVSGIGDEAYFNNGADARQLWVRIDDKVAFVVAFGDVPREDGAQALARLVVAAIR